MAVAIAALLAISGFSLRYRAATRRALAVLLGFLLLPALLLIALAVRLTGPEPVLVRQPETNELGRPSALRFRTWTARDPASREQHPGRCTGVGRFLHRLGLDELPRVLDAARGGVLLPGTRRR